jgi:hypothetical protein
MTHRLETVAALIPLALALAPACGDPPAPPGDDTRHWTGPDLVELDITPWGDQALVDALIDGHGPYALVVDTGATLSGLATQICESLQLPPTGRTLNVLDAGTTVKQMSLHRVGHLDLGGLEVRDLDVLSLDLGLLPGRPTQGILGCDALEQRLLTIDWRTSTCRLERGSLPGPDGDTVLAIRRDPTNLPLLTLTIGDERVEFILDSGSGSGFTLSPEDAGRLAFRAGPTPGMLRASVGSVSRTQVGRLEHDIAIGPVLFVQPIVAILSGESRLGAMVLNQLHFTLDLSRERVRIGREPITARMPGMRSAGIDVSHDGLRWVLWDIIPGTPADDLDLVLGDHLLTVDGVSTAALDMEQIGALIYDGETVHVELERAGQRFEHTLDIVRLVD